jgi:mono/diheme cytochrome c family protein
MVLILPDAAHPEPVEGPSFSFHAGRRRKGRASTSSARAALFVALAITLAACKPADAPKADAPKTAQAGGPPPPPPYQMRSEMPSGDRLSGSKNGEDLFSNRCGACHLAGGMGSNLLTKQRMAMGEPPENGLLANRKDLTPDYVKTVVRMGKNAMPAQTKVDITDAELDAMAAYLGKAKS